MNLKEANYQTINHFLFFNIWWHLSPGTITAFIPPSPSYTLQRNSSMTVPSIPQHRPRKACDRWASKRCVAVRMIESEGASVCQQAGSINLCSDTVQAAFLCKADKTRVSLATVQIHKRKTVFKTDRLAHPSAGSDIGHLGPGHLCWLVLVLTSCDQKSGTATCVNVDRYEPLQVHLFRLLPSSWDILMMRKLWYAWIKDHIRDYWCPSSAHTVNLKLIALSARVTFWALHGKKHRRLTRFCERVFQLQKHLKCCIQIV